MSAEVIHNLTLRRLGAVVTRDRPRADDSRSLPGLTLADGERPVFGRRRRSIHASAHLRSLLVMAERRLADCAAGLRPIADAMVRQQERAR